MTITSVLRRASVALVLPLVLAGTGCSRHDDPPDTPVQTGPSAQTPTNRSSTNSDEANNAPKYTQPGQNSGPPSPLPNLPPANRFDQNTPLASSVYTALQNQVPKASRYITVDTKGSEVRLSGTASAADKAKAETIAHSVKGVTKVTDTIEVK